jgi:hypothetical protein
VNLVSLTHCFHLSSLEDSEAAPADRILSVLDEPLSGHDTLGQRLAGNPRWISPGQTIISRLAPDCLEEDTRRSFVAAPLS